MKDFQINSAHPNLHHLQTAPDKNVCKTRIANNSPSPSILRLKQFHLPLLNEQKPASRMLHQHHLARWLVNFYRKRNSAITHSPSRLMRNCCSFFTAGLWCWQSKNLIEIFTFAFQRSSSNSTICRCTHVSWCSSGERSCSCSPPEFWWCWRFCYGALCIHRMWIMTTPTRDCR